MKRTLRAVCGAALAVCAALVGGSDAQAATINVTGDIATSQTWTADNEYILTDVIYVTSGATLTIEPGTLVRGEPDADGTATTPDAGTLVITRGSKIRALGTVDQPIIFTDLDDDNFGATSNAAATFPYGSRADLQGTVGKWGGLILNGRGYVANNTGGGVSAAREFQIEGLLNVPGEKGLYGGCAEYPLEFDPVGDPSSCDDDDSGTVRYVSLRYGGARLADNNEINGITLGGVGRETEIDFIEVFQNKDDCAEMFGGAVNLKHVICTWNSDDGLDQDEGWRGKVQFALVLQGDNGGADKADKGGELDGGNSPDGSLPKAIPTIYNVTMVGQGGGALPVYTDKAKNTALHFRDNAGGRWYNSAFLDFGGNPACIEGGNTGGSQTAPASAGERAITAYTVDGEIYQNPDSDFELEAQDNTFWCFGAGGVLPNTPAAAVAAGCDTGKEHYDNGWFSNSNLHNTYLSCASALPIRTLTRRVGTVGASRPDVIQSIDPRPAVGSPLLTTNRLPPADGFFVPASYQGAFDGSPQGNWAAGWTLTSRLGFFPNVFPNKATVNVTADIATSITWTADKEYVLTDVIYVTGGSTLTIEPGTVIRGEPDADGSSSTPDSGTLVVTRGSKIQANGTFDAPIVFTDLIDDNIRGYLAEQFPYNSRADLQGTVGKWGGLILNGRGYVANNTAAGISAAREFQIEGLLSAPGEKGLYGGCAEYPLEFDPVADPSSCDDDDSGSINYTQLRYGGALLATANEINGITFGATGRNTDINYVEVLQNKDDCAEMFGGAVNLKHLICTNNSDDGIDQDEGWRGKVQFALVMQGDNGGADKADKGGELDGGNGPDGSLPKAIPTIYNVTMVGQGGGASEIYTDKAKNTALHFRDNAGGRWYNNLFLHFGGNPACIEGGNTGGSQTAPASSGERAIAAYNVDGEIYQNPDSDFELEGQDNTFWCFGAGGVLPNTPASAVTAGCDSGKEHYDNGWFSNSSLQNSYLNCAAALPIRSLTRRAGTVGASRPNVVDQIDPRPAAGSGLTSDRTASADGFFQAVTYRGAFAPGQNWAQGWSATDRLGYFPGCSNGTGAAPGEVSSLRFDGKTMLRWIGPSDANVATYDVLRSSTANNFSAATCVGKTESERNAFDGANPGSGAAFFYLARANNSCGKGSLGAGTSGVERTGSSCP